MARLVAVDRITFNTLATSVDIRAGLKAMGLEIPTSNNGIREAVWRFFEEIKADVKTEIGKKLAADGRFSISVDEYTSSRNRRYMTINLHDEQSIVTCLGMIRVEGSLPAERAVDLTKERLSEFGLEVEKHIFGVVSDGASVMKKYGRIFE